MPVWNSPTAAEHVRQLLITYFLMPLRQRSCTADIYHTLIYQRFLVHLFPSWDTLATEVIKPTKWVSDEQKCNLPSRNPLLLLGRNLAPLHAVDAAPRGSQSSTILPQPWVLCLRSSSQAGSDFIRSAPIASLSIYYHPEAKSWSVQEPGNTPLNFQYSLYLVCSFSLKIS